MAAQIQAAISASIQAAWADPAASADHVLRHAQEMAPEVVRQHIDLYVNPFSLDLGPDGLAAVAETLARGRAAGLLPEGEWELGM